MRYFLIVFVFLFFQISILHAENENPFFVALKGRYMPASDAKGQSGDITMGKIGLRIGYKKEAEDGKMFYATIGPDHYIVDDNTAANIPSDIKSRGIRIGKDFDLPLVEDNRYLFGLELNPTFQSANDVSFNGDAFRFKFSPTIKFKGENGFEWVVGANIRPEFDFVAVPIFGVNYHVNDKLFINLVSDAPNISYALTEKTKAKIEFDYTLDEFEVTKGSRDGAMVSLQDFATGLALEHSFTKNINASVGVGGVFNRILKFEDGTGKAVLDNGIYAGLKVNAAF